VATLCTFLSAARGRFTAFLTVFFTDLAVRLRAALPAPRFFAPAFDERFD